MEEDIKILEELLAEGFEVMRPLEAIAIENILTDYKQKLDALDKNEKFIKDLGKEIDKLQEENKELMKLKENHNYSVDVIRENTKLKYDLFHSIPKAKVEEIIEQYEDKAKRIAGTYQYAGSKEDLEDKKRIVIELRTKAEACKELLKDGGE